MQTIIQAFKNEIIESEKSRIDLLKWKFIAIGALGSIGLGIKPLSSQALPKSGSYQPGVFLTFSFASTLIFCLIPLLCVYIDLLCKHLNIRILVVGNFFLKEHKIEPNKNSDDNNKNSDDNKILELYKEYEEFCDELRDGDQLKSFALEDWAQEISTIIYSFLIIIVAFFSDTSHLKNNLITSLLILLCGVTIVTLIWWFAISIIYKRQEGEEYQKFVGSLIFLVFLLLVALLVTLLPNSIISYSSLSLFSDSRALCIAFFGLLGILISILLNKVHYNKKKKIREKAKKSK